MTDERTTKLLTAASELALDNNPPDFFNALGLDWVTIARMTTGAYPDNATADAALLTGINQGIILARLLDAEAVSS